MATAARKRQRPGARRDPFRAPPPADLDAVFAALKAVLVRHARHLVVEVDAPDEYTLNTRKPGPNGKPMCFGSVLRKRTHVAFHLMPLDVDETLSAALSPALRRRLRGKSWLHFSAPAAAEIEELDRITRAGMAGFERRGLA